VWPEERSEEVEMRKILGLATVLTMSAALSFAAEKTWTGKISDSDCGRSHKSAIEHSGKKISDHDCANACVKEHNAKYVFVSGGKVYNIDNQDYVGLEEHAGHNVRMTGEMTGDTIKVSTIAMMGGKTSSKSSSSTGEKKSY
jgi:hypothetical protein